MAAESELRSRPVFGANSAIPDQQRANQWLTAFCATPEAWEACIGLLNNSMPVTVLFFAANALLVKSRGDWSKLDSNQRAQLSATIGDKMLQLVQMGTDALVVKRLCMVLSAMAARSGPEAVGGLAAQAQALAGAAQGPVSHVHKAAAWAIGQLLAALAMLEAVAQESCELDSSRAAANMRGLLPACSAVLALLQQVLLNPQAAGPHHQYTGSSSSSSSSEQQQQVQQLVHQLVQQQVQEQVQAAGAAAGGRPACLAALSCLQAWCGLEGGGQLGGGRPITAPQLAAQLPALYAALFALLAHPDDDVRQSVCGVLVVLLGAAPSDLQDKQGALWRLAAQEAARQLANLRPQALASTPGAAACASCLAACCAALCSASAEWAAAALPPLDPTTAQAAATAFHAATTTTTTTTATTMAASQAGARGGSVDSRVKQAVADLASGEGDRQAALQVADLVLACLSRPERGVAEACTDYLIDLNTVPVAQRALPLRAGVYASALPLLLAHAAYPHDFTGWDSAAEDEDAFNRFREQQLVEVLECCCALMGHAAFLAQLQQRCEEPSNSWQQCEAALCAAQSVSATVKLHILGRDRGDSGQETRPPDQLAAALSASSRLSALITPLCTQQAGSPAARHLEQPWVCRTACRLIGDYAPWFARAHQLTACATACAAPPQGQQGMAGGPSPSTSPGPSPSPPPEVPLQLALRLLINALQSPVAVGTAAPAFRAVCGRCATSLVQDGLLPGGVVGGGKGVG
ncbi:hypothetical protein QJQ45_015725 [Haematococcus lacustris]|nr:hypothetical protein QJQ45_015725 [Haematococcus lacustris]